MHDMHRKAHDPKFEINLHIVRFIYKNKYVQYVSATLIILVYFNIIRNNLYLV